MIQSMTGFGKAVGVVGNKNISVEVKTLNSKQIDIFTRIPAAYREKDLEIRNFLKKSVLRGKVEFFLTVEKVSGEPEAKLNIPLAKSYFSQIKSLSEAVKLDMTKENILQTLVKMPEVLTTQAEELDEEEWHAIMKIIAKATCELVAFRKQEGESLEKDLLQNVQAIEVLKAEVPTYEQERVENVKNRLAEHLESLKTDVNSERLEQELIYYLEKLDINEEKVRLQNHCEYFKQTLANDEDGVGRKLNFIAQEMGREINTLGSKANHAMIQKLVVQMKDALEKIKEQTLNVL